MLEYMRTYEKVPEASMNFNLSINGTTRRGIYMREPADFLLTEKEVSVIISPQFVTKDGGEL